MAEITARGNVPLLVGGTMLYFKALREGLADLPQADPALRATIDAEAAARGWPALHAELARLDPATAARLAPTDAQRIQRAVEVLRLTGRPLGDFWQDQARDALPFRLLTIALAAPERKLLHERIAQRFRRHAGCRSGRRGRALATNLPAFGRTAGDALRRLSPGLGDAGRTAARHGTADRGIFATRQFAKRQLTWLRSLREAGTIDLESNLAEAATAAKILAQVATHLTQTTPPPTREA